MPIHNTDIERTLTQVADLLEIEGGNPFRVRAYRNAARAVGSMSREAAKMVDSGEELTTIPGVGKDLAQKIETLVRTGSLPVLDELRQRLPPELLGLLDVEGLGPKRVSALYKGLGIHDVTTLKQAAQEGRVRELPGFGATTEQKILQDLLSEKEGRGRSLLNDVEQYAASLVAVMESVPGVGRVVVAGSYRRRRDTVGDLDVLVVCRDSSEVMSRFAGYEDVARVLSRGETRSSVVLRSGLQVDLRVVPEESFGAALHYFTGSKAHNIALRKLAQSRGLKINEYGVFADQRRVAGAGEEEVYGSVGLPFIQPELREDRGEIEAASRGELPELVTLEDIKGDLHVHSVATDGRNTIREMAVAARDRGYAYLAITDHSQRIAMAGGLDEKRLREQMEEIDRLNGEIDGPAILKGIEVDILEDGSLDLPDSVLKELDLVVGSIHSYFKLDRDTQTDRVIRAMDNPHLHVLGHPTGRMLGLRRPYDLDMARPLPAARERGVFLECNAQPNRMDLNDVQLKWAATEGVKVVIATDAHWTRHLDFMRHGIDQARRGWLEAADVVNTRGLKELKKMLRR
ncbi:MAG: DNA polymerase/3'-5' exonuclease PolX [Desulfohalobiaceae bacterium]